MTAHGFVWNLLDDSWVKQIVGEQYLYFEFWNVGKLGGEKYAKAILKKVWKMNSYYKGDPIP